MAEKIKGGKADGVPDSRFPKEKLEQGIKVEKEHTGSREAAKEITKDHYVEEQEATGKKPEELEYYDDLKKIEKSWEKKAFFIGFEKKAYNYDWEARKEEERMTRRQGEQPVHLGKAVGWGAGIGGALGAGMGAFAGTGGGRGLNAALGALAGAGVGSLAGAGTHFGQKADIEDAKTVMGMDPESRGMLLRHRARKSEEGARRAERNMAINQALITHELMMRRGQGA